MSLATLLNSRKNGLRPSHVHVWVGGMPKHRKTPSKWIPATADEVVIDCAGMDLRALSGLPIFTCEIGQSSDLHTRIYTDLEDIGAVIQVAAISPKSMQPHDVEVANFLENESERKVKNIMQRAWRLGNHG
jgi:hypothetical protein